ncbi:MAG: hypothetical protein JNK26_01135 [Candidatus Doudnabacteria bacterium]|nr:hypothetical protein [Candidatus Doudnabacteria bacterium]
MVSKLNYKNITGLTTVVAESISSDFYKLKSSYKALRIYELFAQIITIRGAQFLTNFNSEEQEELKASTVSQLASSAELEIAEEQALIESFYLGLICQTLVHANIPIPESFQIFGKFELLEKEVG